MKVKIVQKSLQPFFGRKKESKLARHLSIRPLVHSSSFWLSFYGVKVARRGPCVPYARPRRASIARRSPPAPCASEGVATIKRPDGGLISVSPILDGERHERGESSLTIASKPATIDVSVVSYRFFPCPCWPLRPASPPRAPCSSWTTALYQVRVCMKHTFQRLFNAGLH